MNYLLIGSGNMAWFLADRMSRAGHTCVGLYARNEATGRELSGQYRLPLYASLSELHDGADACLIAVSDHSVKSIASRLSFTSTTLIHTAGSLPSLYLKDAAKSYGVVWPVYSIRKASLPQERNISVAWEANNLAASKIVRQIALALGDQIAELTSEQRKLLHLSAVFTNNFSNHLLTIANQVCTEAGIDPILLIPILQQTFQPERFRNTMADQTGPARRHDTLTIQTQLELLKDKPEWQDVYEAITNSILALYPAKEA